jgi:hypothetical protein
MNQEFMGRKAEGPAELTVTKTRETLGWKKG